MIFHHDASEKITITTSAIILLGLLSFFVSCRHAKHVSLQCGKLQMDTSVVDKDTIVTPLYFPSDCQNDTKFPAIILVDPQGKPENQVLSYASFAENRRFALIGFKPYQNGKNTSELLHIFKAWWEKTKESFPIDTSRIYLAGFSGGARFVMMLYQNKLIKPRGILFAGLVTPDVLNFTVPVVLTCGLRDFNYQHFLQLFTQSKPENIHFLFFDGKHEWPDSTLLEQGFALLNTHPSSLPEGHLKKQLSGWMHENKWELIYLNLPWLSSVLEKKITDSVRLILSKEFSFEKYLKEIHEEQQQQQNLMAHLSNGDTTFFKRWLDSTNRLDKKKISFTSFNRLERLKSFAGIALYSLSKNAFDKKNPMTYSYLRMYELIEPSNTEMMILHAAYWSEQKKCDKAKIWLNRAYENGFDDKKRLRNMPEFTFCHSTLFGHP